MQNWFKDWFNSEDYLKVYNHRDSLDAQKLSDLILSSTNIPKTAKILDAACGYGRHAIYISSKGYNVVGFDLSKTLLTKAKEETLIQNVSLNLILADIREICFKTKFDLILNLFTSFGYFETDKENFSFIERAFEFLKDNGFYVLDYFNKSYLEKNLIEKSERIIDDMNVIEKRKIENDRVIKEIIIMKKKSTQKFMESVKLYDSQTLIKEFVRSGYKLYNLFGDYDGNNYDEKTSPRLILIFRK